MSSTIRISPLNSLELKVSGARGRDPIASRLLKNPKHALCVHLSFLRRRETGGKRGQETQDEDLPKSLHRSPLLRFPF
jgi:hypothetical protein